MELRESGFQVAVLGLCTSLSTNRRPKPPGTQRINLVAPEFSYGMVMDSQIWKTFIQGLPKEVWATWRLHEGQADPILHAMMSSHL